MKPTKNILIAFILNLSFSVFEFVGGIFTGSVAIISDAVHDIGDAASIGIAFFLEKKSAKRPDEIYTYGYSRYSVIGSAITTLILLLGSAAVIYNAAVRIISPNPINYGGMIIFAVVGVLVNLGAALVTRKGNSLNQKAVNLHIFEDALGWCVVLAGAIVMRFTDFYIIDPLMSIGVSIFILVSAVRNLREALDIFLEKAPRDTDVDEIEKHICKIDGVLGVHHIHVWSMDGYNNYATMHIVADGEPRALKEKIREELRAHDIIHATLELEAKGEKCREEHCHTELTPSSGHHHHHH